jgi:hypothetical protein
MFRHANIPVCIIRLFKGKTFFRTLSRGILIALFLVICHSLNSCATPRHIAYEEQRRGLLMLEGENIYKNKGFYKSRESKKRHKKAIKAHKKNLRR